MSEIKRVQHYHSVTSGATPSADYLLLGELAINASKGDEQLFIKNNAGEIVSFRDYKTIEKIIIDNEKVTAAALSKLDKKVEELSGISNSLGSIEEIESDIDELKNIVGPGFDSKTLSDVIETISGVAYINESNITLNQSATQTINSTLTSHIGNADIHITSADKIKWNKAKSDIDAFLAAADSGETALDTLKELQDYINSDSGVTASVLNNISQLQEIIGSGFTDTTITEVIIDNEEVTATALSELDKKTDELSEKIDNMSSNVSVKTIFGNDLKGEGNVNILSCGTF